MDERNLGEVITIRDDQIFVYKLFRRPITRDKGESDYGRLKYIYEFHSDRNSIFSLYIPTLFEAKDRATLKKVILLAVRYTLNYISLNPQSSKYTFTTKDYENSLNSETRDNNKIIEEILSFLYKINSQKAKRFVNSDDVIVNVNANIDAIYDSLDILSERQLLIEKIDSIDNKFANGTIGLKSYRINFKNEEKIKKVINKPTILGKDQVLSEDYILTLLNNDECENHEIKSSLLADINRYLKGDGKLKEKDELKFNVLKSIVAFLNSDFSDIKYLIIGLLENNKFPNQSKFPILNNIYSLVGIDLEYKENNWDGYQLRLRQFIENHIYPHPFNYLKINKISLNQKDLCIISIGPFEKSPDHWFYLDDDFYIRDGNRTLKLKGLKADNYKKAQSWRN